MAAWVSAKFVTTAAIAVLCRSFTLTVGVACAPHALMISVSTSAGMSIEKRFK
jgi:hypothetical protein